MIGIGTKIRRVLTDQGRSVRWLSEQIPCERTGAYKLLKRDSIDVLLLRRISLILHHDFFKDISEETFG